MSEKFVWDDLYSVQNEEVDNQHKQLFALVNKLEVGLDQKQVKAIIMDLYKYTRRHFASEEKMMKEVGYPKYEEHIILHDDLITKLNEISLQNFDDKEAIWKLNKFVVNWLTEHILHQDMGYTKFLNNN